MRYFFKAIFLFVVTTAVITSGKSAVAKPDCHSSSATELISVSAEGCIEGKLYKLLYKKKSTSIVVNDKNKETILQRIAKGYDPAIVGADAFIGFLPDELQVYKDAGMLVYISAIRTNGGNGGGQCGAGAEIFLNFLNTRSMPLKVESRVLIGSCDESIELMDQDASSRVLGKLSVIDKKLSLQFMHYPGIDGYPTATVSADLKRLEFSRQPQP